MFGTNWLKKQWKACQENAARRKTYPEVASALRQAILDEDVVTAHALVKDLTHPDEFAETYYSHLLLYTFEVDNVEAFNIIYGMVSAPDPNVKMAKNPIKSHRLCHQYKGIDSLLSVSILFGAEKIAQQLAEDPSTKIHISSHEEIEWDSAAEHFSHYPKPRILAEENNMDSVADTLHEREVKMKRQNEANRFPQI